MHIFYKVRLKFKSYTVLFFSLSEDVLWRSFHLMVTLYPLVQLYHMYLTYGSSQRIWTRNPLPHSSFFRICLSFSLVCLFFLPVGFFPIVHAVYTPPHTHHILKSFTTLPPSHQVLPRTSLRTELFHKNTDFLYYVTVLILINSLISWIQALSIHLFDETTSSLPSP